MAKYFLADLRIVDHVDRLAKILCNNVAASLPKDAKCHAKLKLIELQLYYISDIVI